eukprot:SAG11_NODE_7022_length_1207_cov_1.008123_1_plen_98_part_00
MQRYPTNTPMEFNLLGLPAQTLVRPADVPGSYLPLQEVEVFVVEANRPVGGGGGGGRGRGRPRNALSVKHDATQADINRFFGGSAVAAAADPNPGFA